MSESTISPTISEADEAKMAPYLAALKRYESGARRKILDALGLPDESANGQETATIAARLTTSETWDDLRESINPGSRLTLSLFSLSGHAALPARGLISALQALGVEPFEAIRPLLKMALIVLREPPEGPAPDFEAILAGAELSPTLDFLIHPKPLGTWPLVPPDGRDLPRGGQAGQVRESDGLEPLLRLAALWQLAVEAPLRQTQQGKLFKRDRERLTGSPVLSGAVADAIEPLPDSAWLWLALARGVGLLEKGAEEDRLVAAAPDYWSEHAVHLPQMLGSQWLGLSTWQGLTGRSSIESKAGRGFFLLRAVALLWLASLEESEWVALEDLEAHIERLAPGWNIRPTNSKEPTSKPGARPDRSGASSLLEAILLGAAYAFGLVRVAEEVPGQRRLVQISPLGRYVLGLGPPPSPPETFEQFLIIQPNFEVIAYRQGLQPWLIGLLSRFLDWKQLGAAVELTLSAESVYRGLESGLSIEQITARLERHTGRPVPASVSEAFRTWSGRRERLAFHASATLIEFVTPEDLEAALADWPKTDGEPDPKRISERLLLVPESATIPYERFRLAGSRDYRRPAEPCVEVGSDGVTLSVELGRTDLLIDAELSRLADPLPAPPQAPRADASARRWFKISRTSLNRALDEGMTVPQIEQWFSQRAGTGLPPSVRLLLRAASTIEQPSLQLQTLLVLQSPSPELLDGLLQHPDSRELLGERLGPLSVVVPARSLEKLERVAKDLGLSIREE